jgi:hypothetical protein
MGRFLHKSIFNEKHPASMSRYGISGFTELLMHATEGNDYVETINGLYPDLPNCDTLFLRIDECTSIDQMLEDYRISVIRCISDVRHILKKEGSS